MGFYIKENKFILNLNNEGIENKPVSNSKIKIKKEYGVYRIYHTEGDQNKGPLLTVEAQINRKEPRIVIESVYRAAYGMGERFDAVNRKGISGRNEVIEKFCNQGSFTYCPIPFFFTDNGFGVYIDTLRVSQIHFGENIIITLTDEPEQLPEIVFFFGSPGQILREFSYLTGEVRLPPKWVFGPWISANRWNNQAEVENQINLLKQYQFPVSVLVLEAWSDESTFYIWNGASCYKGEDGSTKYNYRESSFWPDPVGMIHKLNQEGIHLILWQVPVIKKCEEGLPCEIHESDRKYAEENRLVALNTDGSPYTIPSGHWFAGSMVPDFTNPDTLKWWFDKRRYLIEMGVDGFKTDGGEFIYKDDVFFYDGSTGKEMRNGFARRYAEVYTDFIGDGRILFSRAGYTGQQRCPVQWAGDQKSTWDELRSILKAGLSIGLSGVPFWSFDIGGFSGTLPTPELYERSTQLAVFTPVMQWHSEPEGGQFSDSDPSVKGVNDRSPWNIAETYSEKELLDRLRFLYRLRANLMPEIYNQALKSSESGLPMMRHLVLDYPGDSNVFDIEDEFMFGDMLIAPIIEEGRNRRDVYLPEGNWVELWRQKVTSGGQWVRSEKCDNRIPVYLREGGAVALNLGDNLKLGSDVGNGIEYKNLCFYITGNCGETDFGDDKGNRIRIA